MAIATLFSHARPADEPREQRPWLTLATVAFGVIMVGLDGSVVAVANPYIARDLHTSLSGLQWITNAYLLVLAVGLIVGGKLGDRYGRKPMFAVGVAGFALASVAVGLVGTTDGVIAFRAVQGGFGALLMPNSLGLLRAAFPLEKLNTAVGIWGASSAIAIAGGPIVGGLLVEHVSWESVFFLNAPVGALALFLTMRWVVDSREAERHRFDVKGLAALAGGLFLVVLALVEAQTWTWSSPRTIGLLAGGAAVLVVFALVESRVEAPLVPLRLFANRSVSLGTVTVLLNFFALYGVLFFISLYLQDVHGFSPLGAGERLLPLTAMFAVSSPLGALLTDKLGPRVAITGGLAAVGVALLMLTGLRVDSPYGALWPAFVLLGLGIGMVVVASTDAIVGNASVDDAGLAGGIQSTAVQLGGVLGTAVLGSVLAGRIASTLVPDLRAHGVPASIAPRFLAAKSVVAQGLAPVTKRMPPSLTHDVTRASHAAFMSGLHTALFVGAVAAFAGAALGLFVRRGEHSGAAAMVA